MKSLTYRYLIGFLSARVYSVSVRIMSVCPFCWAHGQTCQQELDLRTNLWKLSVLLCWPLGSTKLFFSKLPITLRTSAGEAQAGCPSLAFRVTLVVLCFLVPRLLGHVDIHHVPRSVPKWFFKSSLVAWGPIIKFAYLYKKIFCNKK